MSWSFSLRWWQLVGQTRRIVLVEREVFNFADIGFSKHWEYSNVLFCFCFYKRSFDIWFDLLFSLQEIYFEMVCCTQYTRVVSSASLDETRIATSSNMEVNKMTEHMEVNKMTEYMEVNKFRYYLISWDFKTLTLVVTCDYQNIMWWTIEILSTCALFKYSQVTNLFF